jgi:hypothetical protein
MMNPPGASGALGFLSAGGLGGAGGFVAAVGRCLQLVTQGSFNSGPSVRDMRIDKSRVRRARVLRWEGWEGPLIASGQIKDTLKRIGATGTRFEEV